MIFVLKKMCLNFINCLFNIDNMLYTAANDHFYNKY